MTDAQVAQRFEITPRIALWLAGRLPPDVDPEREKTRPLRACEVGPKAQQRYVEEDRVLAAVTRQWQGVRAIARTCRLDREQVRVVLRRLERARLVRSWKPSPAVTGAVLYRKASV